MKRIIAVCIGVLAAVYVGFSAYVVTNQDIEKLLICADDGGIVIPYSKAICRSYLFAFRGSRQDIDDLHGGIGASFVVQGKSPASEREAVLGFLIKHGLDVNRIDVHQLTPLHGAVLANSPEEVAMLLRNGARADVKDKKFGLTPLEFASQLQSDGKIHADRSAVIILLKTARS